MKSISLKEIALRQGVHSKGNSLEVTPSIIKDLLREDSAHLVKTVKVISLKSATLKIDNDLRQKIINKYK